MMVHPYQQEKESEHLSAVNYLLSFQVKCQMSQLAAISLQERVAEVLTQVIELKVRLK